MFWSWEEKENDDNKRRVKGREWMVKKWLPFPFFCLQIEQHKVASIGEC